MAIQYVVSPMLEAKDPSECVLICIRSVVNYDLISLDKPNQMIVEALYDGQILFLRF